MLPRVPAMWSVTILLAIGFCTVNGQLAVINCSPILAANVGAVTDTTVAFVRTCCFLQAPGINQNDIIVTLVGPASQLENFNFSTVSLANLPLNLAAGGIVAVDLQSAAALCNLYGNQLAQLLVGYSGTCFYYGNLLICNSPLFPGSTIIAVNLVYRDGVLIAASPLSQNITLRTPRDYNSIDTDINHHSAGMIVITAVLPILFAVLLAIFSSLLFMSCCCCNNVFAPRKCQQED